MNNIIKLLLFSSVDGVSVAPPENNLTQTKLSCQSLQGTQRDTCVGLKSKEQTEFLEKLKEQLDSLSDGKQGHVKTVINIDSYIVKEADCKDDNKDGNNIKNKTATEGDKTANEGDADSGSEGEESSATESDSDDDEESKVAKKETKKANIDVKKAIQEAEEAERKEAEAKQKAAQLYQAAKLKAAKKAEEARLKAEKEAEEVKKLAEEAAEKAKKDAAEEAAQQKKIAEAEQESIKRKQLEEEAEAKKKAAEEEAAAKEKEQKEIAEATKKAKEEEAEAKKKAQLDEAKAKKLAEEEAAAAEAELAKKKAEQAKLAAKKSTNDLKAVKKQNPKRKTQKWKMKHNKNTTKTTKTTKTKTAGDGDSDDENEGKQKTMKTKKSAIKIKTVDEDGNSTTKAKTVKSGTATKEASSDDDEDTKTKKDPKKAAEDEEKAKKKLKEDEEEEAEKEQIEKKKTVKVTKAEKRAKAAEEAAEKAEQEAKDKKKKADDENDKTSTEEAEKAEQEAKEKRLLADAAQLKAKKAADAAKKAHEDSTKCARVSAKDAKKEDEAEQALKDALKAKKEADEAAEKAKQTREKEDKDKKADKETEKEKEKTKSDSEDENQKNKVKKEGSSGDEGDNQKPAKKVTSDDEEEEKKKQEAEEAQRKAEEAAKAVAARKEQIRKELLEKEEKAKREAEEAEKAAAEKARKESEELERKAKEAAEKAAKAEELERKKAAEEAERKAKQLALEAEERKKAKLAAEEEARKAEREAKEKAERAIRLAKDAEKKAAEAKAKKEAEYRAERVAFLDKMPNQVMKGSDKPFVNNEQFNVIMYNDKKVSILRGKFSFRARSYQEAFEKFADLIKPTMMKDTDAEFGLVGNKKLLATTSVFNDNLKDKKVKLTGDEYKDDEISMIMLAEGLKENVIDWPETLMNHTINGQKQFQMVIFSNKTKNATATLKALGGNDRVAIKEFEAETKKGAHGILLDRRFRWIKWSADYNMALQAVSQYFFSKGYYLGVVYDEEKAGFEMQWQAQEKMDAKIKSITGQFTGDGSVFARQEYFYIWMWSYTTGKVTFVSRGSFWKMGDAYSWYIQYVTNYLKRDYRVDFLLVGSNSPLLSTAEWSSDINKLMIGKAVSGGQLSLKQFYEGTSGQYYMLLKNKKSGAFLNEGLGSASNKAYKTFGEKVSGNSALFWGILYHSNGKIYKINGDTTNKDLYYRGENWGYWVLSDWIMTQRKTWTTWVHTEKECNIVLKKEEDERKAQDAAWRKEHALRIMKYGGDLIDNFNGTGYKFARNEKFIAIRFDVVRSQINAWSYYATNMDLGYEKFGKTIKGWATTKYKDIRYNPEEYFLFGNNRLLLSSLSTMKVENDGMNITNAVIGWAYDKKLYVPDDGLLDPDNYKGFWTLLQERATNKTTFAKCEGSLAKCSQDFEKVTAYDRDDPEKGSRGVILKGSKDSIQKFSVEEFIVFPKNYWNFRTHLYSLVGDFMANNNEGDFDSLYVPDESNAGFEIKAPYYKNKRLFHSMVNILQSNKRYYQVHGWWDTYYLKGPVTYYADINKWWKNQYGNKNTADMVQVLTVDVDKFSSKVVMLFKPGQMLNDTRMFLNFGELARIKGYAPNNCTYKVGKGENIKMVHKDIKTGDIIFTDTKTTNWDSAKSVAKKVYDSKLSTGEIWLVYTDQKVYNIYKDSQNPLGELMVLGQWIFESCPDYQRVHPTDVELGFETIYEK